MGVDLRDVDIVVHIGCPKSTITYWQEAGRCARDGRKGLNVIMYDNFSLALKTTAKDITDVVRGSNSQCIRREILLHLSVEDNPIGTPASCDDCSTEECVCQACICCSFCKSKCKCDKKTPNNIEFFLH